MAEDTKEGIVAAEVVAAVEGEVAGEEAAEMGIGFAPIQGKFFPFKICFMLNIVSYSHMVYHIVSRAFLLISLFDGVVTEIGHLGVAAGI